MSIGVQAQVPPIPPTDAGKILQEFQGNSLPEITTQKNQPEVDVERQSRQPMSKDPGISFLVAGFKITGNTVIPTADLKSKLNLLVGKKLTLTELRSAADMISDYYREKGYLVARAYIPKQEIQNGIVEIQIIEGRRDQVKLSSQGESLVNPSVQTQFINSAMPRNQVLSEAALERGLLLLGDTPGVTNVKGTVEPGGAIGTSDLNIQTTPAGRFFGSIDADNFGGRYSGAERVGATLGLNSLTGYGDQLTLRLQTTGPASIQQGGDTNYGRIAYQLPVGSDGLKFGVAYAAMRYQLGLNYQGTNTNGTANTASVFASYPFVRSREFNLYAQAGYDNIHMVNNSYGFELSNLSVNQATLGVSGNSRDSIFGGGINTFGLTGTFGNVGAQNDNGYVAADNETAKTLGGFQRYNFNFSRLQALTGSTQFLLNTSGQFATQNLNSSQQFTLGGPMGVRAYPVGQAYGAQGLLAQLELQQTLLDSSPVGLISGIAFYDVGVTQLFKNTWANWNIPNATTGQSLSNNTSLQGAGLGLKATISARSYLSLTWAHSIGTSQSMRVYGVNSNGLSQTNTAWFQGVLQY